VPQCRDGIDNDHDHKIDYPADKGCTSPDDPYELGKKATKRFLHRQAREAAKAARSQ